MEALQSTRAFFLKPIHYSESIIQKGADSTNTESALARLSFIAQIISSIVAGPILLIVALFTAAVKLVQGEAVTPVFTELKDGLKEAVLQAIPVSVVGVGAYLETTKAFADAIKASLNAPVIDELTAAQSDLDAAEAELNALEKTQLDKNTKAVDEAKEAETDAVSAVATAAGKEAEAAKVEAETAAKVAAIEAAKGKVSAARTAVELAKAKPKAVAAAQVNIQGTGLAGKEFVELQQAE